MRQIINSITKFNHIKSSRHDWLVWSEMYISHEWINTRFVWINNNKNIEIDWAQLACEWKSCHKSHINNGEQTFDLKAFKTYFMCHCVSWNISYYYTLLKHVKNKSFMLSSRSLIRTALYVLFFIVIVVSNCRYCMINDFSGLMTYR
jgi:hypothetical protein